ncbi:hypothetical protein KCP75_16185 [Salmonella enterica subsp. enterica]|nr:hypothetical protein KCP75_16185 [Salmonella enterica subsp. enterica]
MPLYPKRRRKARSCFCRICWYLTGLQPIDACRPDSVHAAIRHCSGIT